MKNFSIEKILKKFENEKLKIRVLEESDYDKSFNFLSKILNS